MYLNNSTRIFRTNKFSGTCMENFNSTPNPLQTVYPSYTLGAFAYRCAALVLSYHINYENSLQ